MSFRLNDRKFKRVTKRAKRYVEKQLPKETLKKFKENTPVDKGNARRKTKLRKTRTGFQIQANYNYARVLDEGLFPNPPKEGTGKTSQGYSTQAPKGMSEPTIDWLKKDVTRTIKRLSRSRGLL